MQLLIMERSPIFTSTTHVHAPIAGTPLHHLDHISRPQRGNPNDNFRSGIDAGQTCDNRVTHGLTFADINCLYTLTEHGERYHF